MAEYIDKEDLKFLEIPIAPVLQGEQIHYEKVFLKEWLENVPTADVIEREKIDKAIEEIQKLRGCSCSYSDGIIDDVEDILDKLISESEVEE